MQNEEYDITILRSVATKLEVKYWSILYKQIIIYFSTLEKKKVSEDLFKELNT